MLSNGKLDGSQLKNWEWQIFVLHFIIFVANQLHTYFYLPHLETDSFITHSNSMPKSFFCTLEKEWWYNGVANTINWLIKKISIWSIWSNNYILQILYNTFIHKHPWLWVTLAPPNSTDFYYEKVMWCNVNVMKAAQSFSRIGIMA